MLLLPWILHRKTGGYLETESQLAFHQKLRWVHVRRRCWTNTGEDIISEGGVCGLSFPSNSVQSIEFVLKICSSKSACQIHV